MEQINVDFDGRVTLLDGTEVKHARALGVPIAIPIRHSLPRDIAKFSKRKVPEKANAFAVCADRLNGQDSDELREANEFPDAFHIVQFWQI